MKQLILFISIFFLCFTITAQQGDRIKPSKIIKATQITTDAYDTIEIYNDFHVFLAPGDAPLIHIEANDNLLEAIDITVNSGALSLRTVKEIRGKKTLNITINYSQNLKRIVLHDEAKLSADAPISLPEITVEANDNAETFMTIDGGVINVVTTDKSKSGLDLNGDKVSLKINSNGIYKGTINAENLYTNLYERSKMTLEGDIENLMLETDSNSFFSGNALDIANANIVAKGTSDIHIRALKILNIAAVDKSKVFVYGNPKLDIQEFEGEAAVFKKPE